VSVAPFSTSLFVRASSPYTPKAMPPPPPAAAAETAAPGSHALAGGPAATAPMSSGVAAEEVPTTPKATAASTTVMPLSTSSAVAEQVPTAPTSAIDGDAGGAPSSILPPTLKEAEVVFWRRLRSGAEPDVAPIPLPRVLSRAHQALNETEAAIRREWEALESEHQRLSDWSTQLEEHTKAASRQFAFERSKLARDRQDYKRDL
jgi:hypothetical protein